MKYIVLGAMVLLCITQIVKLVDDLKNKKKQKEKKNE